MSEPAEAQLGKAYGEQQEERANIVKEFEWATTALDQVIDTLYAHLQPILRPDYPDTTAGVDTPAEEVSAARAQLHHLHALTASVRKLIDRLEV